MAEENMIHKSNVYFDVVVPMLKDDSPSFYPYNQMHHGEIYVFQNKIYLRDDSRWYKANIWDIRDIKTMLPLKLILIRFWNYDMVISCKEHSHLLALRDFLSLSQNYFKSKNFSHRKSWTINRNHVH